MTANTSHRTAPFARRLGTWVLLLSASILGCSKSAPPITKKPLRKVTVGIQVSPAMTLVMVAKDRALFSREGLDVDLKEFTAGKFALQAFLSKSIDFAVSGEVPVCLATLQGNSIRVITQVVERTTTEVRVVALKDGGSSDPATYFKAKRRKLATSFGGGPEFFTYNFLRKHQIPERDVEIISQKPEDMPAALASRSVDAISIFDPFAFIAEQRLGNDAQTFADPSLYSEYYVLSAHPDQIAATPETIHALVRALVSASDFIQENPAESKAIMQRYTKLDRAVVEGIWDNFIFRPALVRQLVDYWNDQALWAKRQEKVRPDTKTPDFRAIVDERFLMAAKPDAVRM